MEYTENACCVEHNGKAFCAGGAFVTPAVIVAYCGKDGALTDWHGAPLGTWKCVASWTIPFSPIGGDKMLQIEATVDGIRYTGRGFGAGMIYKGKRKARQ